jgi:demethylmenaquinone methyltransferase/2-methoxy-6-polyprenyl-1,4-benzoquinol methylase
MDAAPQRELVERFFSGTGMSYRLTATVGTLGFDLWWKRRILAAVPADAVRIVDQASGTGILTFGLARRVPGSLVVGVELRREYAALAQEEKRRRGVANVCFVQGRAEEVAFRPPVDCIASSYLAKYADLDALAANAAGMLRPGGAMLLHDFTYPASRILAGVWEAYLGLLGAAWSRLFPAWREALDGLPALLRHTTWVADAVGALERHGFEAVRVRRLTWGAAALVTARRGPGGSRGTGR